MLRFVKKLMFSPVVMFALVMAAVGIRSASWLCDYQPAPPVRPE